MSKRGHDTDSMLARARAGIQNVRKTTIPSERGGEAIQVAFVLAPGNVKQEAVARTLARLEELKIPPELRLYEDMEGEQSWQLLWAVMREPDNLDRHAAKSVDELRELLTVDERDKLLNEFLDFEDEYNPRIDLLTDAELARISEALKKKDHRSLIACGSCALANYMISTADPSPTSPRPSCGSGGSNDEEP